VLELVLQLVNLAGRRVEGRAQVVDRVYQRLDLGLQDRADDLALRLDRDYVPHLALLAALEASRHERLRRGRTRRRASEAARRRVAGRHGWNLEGRVGRRVGRHELSGNDVRHFTYSN